jgi:hypothetical protein
MDKVNQPPSPWDVPPPSEYINELDDTQRARADDINASDPPAGQRTVHFDRQGRRINLGEWSALLNTVCYRLLHATFLEDQWGRAWVVSTVWTGVASDIYPPFYIFLTGMFCAGKLVLEDKWPDEASASSGHNHLVERFRFGERFGLE